MSIGSAKAGRVLRLLRCSRARWRWESSGRAFSRRWSGTWARANRNRAPARSARFNKPSCRLLEEQRDLETHRTRTLERAGHSILRIHADSEAAMSAFTSTPWLKMLAMLGTLLMEPSTVCEYRLY